MLAIVGYIVALPFVFLLLSGRQIALMALAAIILFATLHVPPLAVVLVWLLLNVAIYVALIGFVAYAVKQGARIRRLVR